jgi:hypothetical protein
MIVPKQNKRGRKTRQNPKIENIKTNALKPLYNRKLVIKNSKFKDLLHLKQFLMKAKSHKFYENLKTEEVDIEDSENEYIDNIPLNEVEIKNGIFNYTILNLKLSYIISKNRKLSG